jgi:rare lipoprotein A
MSRFGVVLMVLIGLALVYDAYGVAERSVGSSAFVQNGIASWYGREEQGRPTADGEVFDRHEFTAASRNLPFNTIVRVTNKSNGRSVQVRINDRGPWLHSRVLDLSEAAADTLDMKKSGTAPVEIEVVEPASADASVSSP